MAGSVFSKIAERVYAKDLRLPLTNAIDTNSVVIPHVKAGEMRRNATGIGRTEYQYTRQNCRFRAKRFGEIHTLPRKLWFWRVGAIMQNFVPSVIGMGAKDAVYLLESKGLKVNLVGVGKVKSQSIANGTIIKEGTDNVPLP